MHLFFKVIIFVSAALIFTSCAGADKPSTPLETLKAYTNAIKQKDTATMKFLLSKDSIEMARQEAKSQNVALDEIVKRETLFNENQRAVEFRNEKIDGDKATIEMKDSFETWNTVPFVREDGAWKIDKPGIANQMMKGFDEKNNELDNKINEGRIP